MTNPETVAALVALLSSTGFIDQLRQLLSGNDVPKPPGKTGDLPPTEEGIEFIPPLPRGVSTVASGRFGLGDFATTHGGFREHLKGVRDSVSNYVTRERRSRPLNILMAAPPGSGKSFFIEQLLSSLDGVASTDIRLGKLPYFALNVSNISSVGELDSAWQFVHTMNSNGLVPAVFFDEVDAVVAGHRVYRQLLSPMYDGAIYRGSLKIEIGSALLFFAANSFPGESHYERALFASHPGVPTGSVEFTRWRLSVGEQLRSCSQATSSGDAGSTIGKSVSPDARVGGADPNDRRQDFLDRIDEFVVFPRHKIEYVGWTKAERAVEAIAIAMSLIRKHFPHCTGADAMAVAVVAGMVQEHDSRRHAERLVFTATNPTGEVFELGSLGLDKIPGLSEESVQELRAESGKAILRVADSSPGTR